MAPRPTLSARELAEWFGVQPQTIRRWASDPTHPFPAPRLVRCTPRKLPDGSLLRSKQRWDVRAVLRFVAEEGPSVLPDDRPR